MTVVAIADFAGEPSASQLTMAANDALVVLDRTNEEWWWVRHSNTNVEGFVPATYVQEQAQTTSLQEEVHSSHPYR